MRSVEPGQAATDDDDRGHRDALLVARAGQSARLWPPMASIAVTFAPAGASAMASVATLHVADEASDMVAAFQAASLVAEHDNL
jgi:hypothetical protein